VSSTTVKVLKWAGKKAIAAATPAAADGTCPAEPKRAGRKCGKKVRNSRGRKTDDLTCGHPDCATWYAIHHMGL
jgi:hypothetical protein